MFRDCELTNYKGALFLLVVTLTSLSIELSLWIEEIFKITFCEFLSISFLSFAVGFNFVYYFI